MLPLVLLRVWIALLVLAAGLAPASSWAASLSTKATACSAKIVNETCEYAVGTGSAQAESQFGGPGAPPETLISHAQNEAAADFGSLSGFGVYDAIHVDIYNFSVYPFNGQAIFRDALTVSGGSGSGSARITFHLSGAVRNGCDAVKACVSGLPLAHAVGGISFVCCSEGGVFALSYYLQTSEPPALQSADVETDLVTEKIPFHFGQPFNVVATLDVIMNVAFDFPPDSPSGANSQGLASASVALVGIELFDATGAPLPGAVVSSESGHSYPVPEPAATASAAAAVLVVATLRAAKGRAGAAPTR